MLLMSKHVFSVTAFFRCLYPFRMAIAVLPFIISCTGPQEGYVGRGAGGLEATDGRGHTVILDQPARRVVVLFQALLDAMYMLGAEDAIVGIQQRIYQEEDAYTYFGRMDSRIARKELAAPGYGVGGGSPENIVALRPDLVILAATEIGAISLLESMGIPVFAVSSNSDDEIYSEIGGLGVLLDKRDRAQELIQYARDMKRELLEKHHHITPKKKVYYAWSRGRIYSTSGRNSRMNACFEMAGVENACPYDLNSPNVNAETIIAWNPDIILLWNTQPEEVYNLEELSVLPAVKHRSVYDLTPPFLYDPHTLKILVMALEVNHIAYPSATPEDIKRMQQDILHQLYGEKAKNILQ